MEEQIQQILAEFIGRDERYYSDKLEEAIAKYARRIAALMDGCYGCSARVTSCTQFEVGAPCLRTPTEPKE